MKVAMIGPDGGSGGIAAYSRDLADALGEHAEVTFEPLRADLEAQALRELAARANRADVVHIQHEHGLFDGIARGQAGFWTLRYAIERPVVITAHNSQRASKLVESVNVGPLQKLWLKARLRSQAYRDSVDIAPFVTGRCITLTGAERDALIGRGAQQRYVRAIPAGAPLPVDALPDPRGFRDRYGLGDERIVLQSLRGTGVLATSQILNEIPPGIAVVFVTLIDGAELPRAVLKPLQAHERARVLPPMTDDELRDAVAEAEVVLAGGGATGGPRDVLQALAYGKPVLAPDLAVFREIQERVPCLRLVRNRDAGHLAACLKAVLANEAGRAEMAERGLLYGKRFSWRWVAGGTMEVYRQTIADEAVAMPH